MVSRNGAYNWRQYCFSDAMGLVEPSFFHRMLAAMHDVMRLIQIT